MTIAIPHGPSYHDGETEIQIPIWWVSRREGLDTIATGPHGEEVRLWWHRGRIVAAGPRGPGGAGVADRDPLAPIESRLLATLSPGQILRRYPAGWKRGDPEPDPITPRSLDRPDLPILAYLADRDGRKA